MKHILRLSVMCIALSVLPTFSGCDCLDCVCKGVAQADLLFSFISKEIIGDGAQGNQFYKIGSGLVNLIDTLACNTENASESFTRQRIFYSSDGNFDNNSELVDTISFKADQLTATGKSQSKAFNQYDELEFLIDGFYQIIRNADARADVSERNENNNEIDDEKLSGRQSGDMRGIVVRVANKGRTSLMHVRRIRSYSQYQQ